jgi:RNA polymerase sigma-B factor
VAALGLVKAVDRWDPDRGVELTTYAMPTVLGELRHYFRDQTWGVKPPRGLQDLSSAIERSRDALQAELGRTPTVADLARRLDCSREEVLEALQATGGRSLESLEAAVYDEGDTIGCVGALIPFHDPELERVEERVTLERLTGILDDRTREVLRLRFAEDMLQSEIAARVGWSQMHVSRILRASLEKLHDYATRATPAAALRA